MNVQQVIMEVSKVDVKRLQHLLVSYRWHLDELVSYLLWNNYVAILLIDHNVQVQVYFGSFLLLRTRRNLHFFSIRLEEVNCWLRPLRSWWQTWTSWSRERNLISLDIHNCLWEANWNDISSSEFFRLLRPFIALRKRHLLSCRLNPIFISAMTVLWIFYFCAHRPR